MSFSLFTEYSIYSLASGSNTREQRHTGNTSNTIIALTPKNDNHLILRFKVVNHRNSKIKSNR